MMEVEHHPHRQNLGILTLIIAQLFDEINVQIRPNDVKTRTFRLIGPLLHSASGQKAWLKISCTENKYSTLKEASLICDADDPGDASQVGIVICIHDFGNWASPAPHRQILPKAQLSGEEDWKYLLTMRCQDKYFTLKLVTLGVL